MKKKIYKNEIPNIKYKKVFVSKRIRIIIIPKKTRISIILRSELWIEIKVLWLNVYNILLKSISSKQPNNIIIHTKPSAVLQSHKTDEYHLNISPTRKSIN